MYINKFLSFFFVKYPQQPPPPEHKFWIRPYSLCFFPEVEEQNHEKSFSFDCSCSLIYTKCTMRVAHKQIVNGYAKIDKPNHYLVHVC